jgi:hypothetical protein
MVDTPIGYIKFYIVYADTRFLLYLADIDALQVYYNNLSDTLIILTGLFLVIHQFSYSFLYWEESFQLLISDSLEQNPCLLSMIELRRLHCHFKYPSVDRLHRVLEYSGHEDIEKQTLNYLIKYCDFCQYHKKSPGTFKFMLWADQDPVFNHFIFVDIMYINGDPVLHIVNKATRFQAVRW